MRRFRRRAAREDTQGLAVEMQAPLMGPAPSPVPTEFSVAARENIPGPSDAAAAAAAARPAAPSRAASRLLVILACNAVATVLLVPHPYLNLGLCVAAPSFGTYVFLCRRRLPRTAPDLHRYLLDLSFGVSLVLCALSFASFCSPFWHRDWAGYSGWGPIAAAVAVVAAAHVALTTASLVVLRRAAVAAARAAASRPQPQPRVSHFVSTAGRLRQGGADAAPAGPEGFSVTVWTAPGADAGMAEEAARTLGCSVATLLSFVDPHRFPFARAGSQGVAAASLSLLVKRSTGPVVLAEDADTCECVESVGLFVMAAERRLVVVEPSAGPVALADALCGAAGPEDAVVQLLRAWVRSLHVDCERVSMAFDEVHRGFKAATNNAELLSLFKLTKALAYYQESVASNSKAIERAAELVRPRLSAACHALAKSLAVECANCLATISDYFDIHTDMMDAHGSVIANNVNLITENQTILLISHSITALLASLGAMSEATILIKYPAVGFPVGLAFVAAVGCTAVTLVRSRADGDLWTPSLSKCLTPQSRWALATLMANAKNGYDYVPAVVALAASWNMTVPEEDRQLIDLVALIDDSLMPDREALLNRAGWRTVRIKAIVRNEGSSVPERFRTTFTKIHVWNLVEYSTVLFVDADTLVLREELRDAFCLAEGFPEGHIWTTKLNNARWNSGAMLLKPSARTFEEITDFVRGGSWGFQVGGDQDMLNAFWRTDGHQRHVLGRNFNVGADRPSETPYEHSDGAALLHFLALELKPWDLQDVRCARKGSLEIDSVPRSEAAKLCDASGTQTAGRILNNHYMYWWGVALAGNQNVPFL
eukprot:m51a1_g5186 putative isoform b (826) ;mRNA; r:185726-189521